MSVHSSASGGGLALPNSQYAAAIMMDLSKAFDCVPHGMLLGELLSNYLSDRKQTVKLGPHYNELSNITKVVHYGSSVVQSFYKRHFQAFGRSSIYIIQLLRAGRISLTPPRARP